MNRVLNAWSIGPHRLADFFSFTALGLESGDTHLPSSFTAIVNAPAASPNRAVCTFC